MRSVGRALFIGGIGSGMVLGLAVRLELAPRVGYVGVAPLGLVVAGLLLLWLDDRMARYMAGRLVRRLRARPEPPQGPWRLPAPESYMLLRGVRRARPDAFRVGCLHLIAAGVLKVSLGATSVTLSRDAAKRATPGSLAAICNLWTSASTALTINELARRVKLTYGNADGFGNTVLSKLVNAGVFDCQQCGSAIRHPTVSAETWHAFYACDHVVTMLTRDGEAARADLERHVAEALRLMWGRRAVWMERQPREALMAAVILVAARREPTDTLPEPDVDWSFADHCAPYFAIDFDAARAVSGVADGGDGDAGGD